MIPIPICQCGLNANVLFYHSIYYYGVDDIIMFLLNHRRRGNDEGRKMAYSIQHDYRDPFGTINQELQYKITPIYNNNYKSYVIEVNGQSSSRYYVGSALDWRRNEMISTINNVRYRLVMQPHIKVFDTELVSLHVEIYNLPATVRLFRGFDEVIRDVGYYGNVSLPDRFRDEAQPTRLYPVAIRDNQLISYGRFFIVVDHGVQVTYLPKGLIEDLSMMITYVERTHETFRMLNESAKRRIRKYQIPVDRLQQSLYYCVAIAFVDTIDREINTMAAVVQPRMENISRVNKILKFDIPSSIGLRTYNLLWSVSVIAVLHVATKFIFWKKGL
jgi:hypothetical protein